MHCLSTLDGVGHVQFALTLKRWRVISPSPTRCGSSKNVSSKEMVKPWILVNFLCFFKVKAC